MVPEGIGNMLVLFVRLMLLAVVLFVAALIALVWLAISEVTATPEPEASPVPRPTFADPTYCVVVERGEWHEEYGCILQEQQP